MQTLDDNLVLLATPIGIVRTGFSAKYHAPHQPDGKADGIAHITLHPHNNYEQALRHLDGFERIWVLWWFHQTAGWKPIVQAPRDTTKHGVFATRSPHRPNPIGITCCRLLNIADCTLTIADADMLDGTPVLDIKPYIPHYDSFPDACAGWVDTIQQKRKALSIEWSNDALVRCDWLALHGDDIRIAIERKLLHNPTPTSNNRIKKIAEGYEIAQRAWRIGYYIQNETQICIYSVKSFYTTATIESAIADLPLPDAERHAAFLLAFAEQQSGRESS